MRGRVCNLIVGIGIEIQIRAQEQTTPGVPAKSIAARYHCRPVQNCDAAKGRSHVAEVVT